MRMDLSNEERGQTMRRVLFVDDEPRILEGLENLMFTHMGEWEVELATSGQAAMDLLARKPCDLVVTDMRMPVMDGAGLLERVRLQHPEIVRVVLSGHAEVNQMLSVLPLAHQYLCKPCKPEVLQSLLRRTSLLSALVRSKVLKAQLGSIQELPARPRTYSQIEAVMARPNFGLKEVAEVIERDMSVCTSVLHRVNTGFFCRGAVIRDTRQAVARLGIKTVRDVVLGCEVFGGADEMPGIDADELNDHSFLVAQIARAISPAELQEMAFLAGLLHDVGYLVLELAMPGSHREVSRVAAHKRSSINDAELETLGVTHARAGAYLLGAWGMPLSLVEAVAFHHEPNQITHADTSLLTRLHFADCLVSGRTDEMDFDHIERAGAARFLGEWIAKAEPMMEAMK